MLAGVQLLEEVVSHGMAPPLVIFATGRPSYLDLEADTLSEG